VRLPAKKTLMISKNLFVEKNTKNDIQLQAMVQLGVCQMPLADVLRRWT
jgi:hypothetical protein